MHLYDTVLKSLLTGSRNSLIAYLMGGSRRGRWLNVELPTVNQPRVDLLFERLPSGELISIEFQSQNDSALPFRMAEYAVLVHRAYGRYPKQIVIYIGSDPLHMPSELVTPYLTCSYTVMDVREWEAETFLRSPYPADAILAILGRHSERRETIRRILRRIAKLKRSAQKVAFTKLLLLAKLRRLTNIVEKEIKRMPIDLDIMDHEIFGPLLRQRGAEAAEAGMQKGLQRGLQKGMQKGMQRGLQRGMQKGMQRGLQKGMQRGLQKGMQKGIVEGIQKGLKRGLKEGLREGRTEEALSLMQRQISARFGRLSPTTKHRLTELSLPELEKLAVRLLTASSLRELFQ